MTAAVPWLPPPAAGDLEDAMVRLVGGWLEGWIGKAGPLKVPPRARGEIRPAEWIGDADAMVAVPDEGILALGNAACCGRADPHHPGDAQLLRTLAIRMIEDFHGFLVGNAAGSPPSALSRSRAIPPVDLFSVGPLSGEWMLFLGLSQQCQIDLRRRAAGASRTVSPGNRKAALATLKVELGCHLGDARLMAGDIASLAPGDVVMLTGKTDGALDLTIEGHQCQVGKAFVTSTPGGAEIRIVERPGLARKVG